MFLVVSLTKIEFTIVESIFHGNRSSQITQNIKLQLTLILRLLPKSTWDNASIMLVMLITIHKFDRLNTSIVYFISVLCCPKTCWNHNRCKYCSWYMECLFNFLSDKKILIGSDWHILHPLPRPSTIFGCSPASFLVVVLKYANKGK